MIGAERKSAIQPSRNRPTTRHEHAHDDRQERHERHVVRRAGGRDVGDPGREERCDGGVGADRQLGGRAQHGERARSPR